MYTCPYTGPRNGADFQSVADLMVDDIQHHIDNNGILCLVGRDQDGSICTAHVIVQDLPLPSVLHRGPGLRLPDVILREGD